MTIIISKKHIISLIVFVILLITAGIAGAYIQTSYFSKPVNRVLSSTEEASTEAKGTLQTTDTHESKLNYADTMEMPFASCVSQINNSGEVSTTYNTDTPFSPAFLEGHNATAHNGFMDVNGDNLVDYVYSDSRNNGSEPGGPGVYNEFIGCVYLNNGSGWTKAFQCSAYTYTDPVTGVMTSGQFRGDCAGSVTTAKTNSTDKQ